MRKVCVRFGSAWSHRINTPEETVCVRPVTWMNEHRTKVTIIQMHTHPDTLNMELFVGYMDAWVSYCMYECMDVQYISREHKPQTRAGHVYIQ